mgnify:CR=1 FL=1
MNKKADCLSRLPMVEECDDGLNEYDSVEECLIASVRWDEDISISEVVWRRSLMEVVLLQKVMHYVTNGWPKERGPCLSNLFVKSSPSCP